MSIFLEGCQEPVQGEDTVKIRGWVGTSPLAGQGRFAAQHIKKGTWMMQDIGHLSACRLEDDPYGDHARPLPRHGLVRALDAHESG